MRPDCHAYAHPLTRRSWAHHSKKRSPDAVLLALPTDLLGRRILLRDGSTSCVKFKKYLLERLPALALAVGQDFRAHELRAFIAMHSPLMWPMS